jgi:hypothetical protein
MKLVRVHERTWGTWEPIVDLQRISIISDNMIPDDPKNIIAAEYGTIHTNEHKNSRGFTNMLAIRLRVVRINFNCVKLTVTFGFLSIICVECEVWPNG